MFKKAVKNKTKLKCALHGISGSGKTMGALRMATGLGGKIAVIDSEYGSSAKYADKFDFDIANLETKDIMEYIKTIRMANNIYDILIIDSISHAWASLLEHNAQLTENRYKGNSFQAWSKSTPIQKEFLDAILSFNGHVIVTMRSKVEWAMNVVDGKTRPKRMGLAPEQGKGIEYEFDMLIEIDDTHTAIVNKDRTGKFQDKMFMIDESFGEELREWLYDGQEYQFDKDDILKLKKQLGLTNEVIKNIIVSDFKEKAINDMSQDDLKLLMDKMKGAKDDVE